MKRIIIIITCFLPFIAIAQYPPGQHYQQDDPALYRTIVMQDSLFFHAYNTCSEHLTEYAAYYSDSLEFYHDRGGLSRSKTQIVQSTNENICGKVTRELVKGSIEVYPIKDYGAIEIGLHIFHNSQEPPPKTPKVGRFVIVWEHTSDRWKITRVISLH